MSEHRADSEYLDALGRLTPTELDVIRYRCAGRTSGEIAALLSMPVETAKYLLADIYDKLEITWQQETTSLAALSRYCPYVPQVTPPGATTSPEQVTQQLPPQPSARAFELVEEDDEALMAQRVPSAEETPAQGNRTLLFVFGGIAAAVIIILILFFTLGGGGSNGTPTPGVSSIAATQTAIASQTAAAAAQMTPTPAPTVTPQPTPTPSPPTPTPVPPTPTPLPPTPTAEPSPTPAPTPTTVPTAAPTVAPTAAPTAIPTPVTGNVAYEANWSTGAGDWQLGTGWKVDNGSLESAAGASSIAAPFTSPGPNYAVEADITILSGTAACPDGAGLFGRGTAGNQVNFGYSGVTCQNAWAILASRLAGGQSDTLAQGDRQTDQSMHTYRLEIQGDQQRLFIDSTFVGQSTDNRWTDPGIDGIYLAGDYVIRVSGFRVYELP